MAAPVLTLPKSFQSLVLAFAGQSAEVSRSAGALSPKCTVFTGAISPKGTPAPQAEEPRRLRSVPAACRRVEKPGQLCQCHLLESVVCRQLPAESWSVVECATAASCVLWSVVVVAELAISYSGLLGLY